MSVDISDLGIALSNPTRVNLLQLLSDSNYEASEAHEVYNRTFKQGKHRESIYRELEKLVDIGLAEKDYNQEEKRLVYSLPYEFAKVDFANSEIVLSERADD